ncbi:MAG: protein rep [Selenomonadaceae bacterium]|nr:protein rep [Selenomonadaceae bacterium]
MQEEISDTRLLGKLRRILSSHPKERKLAKSTFYCGSRIIPQPMQTPAVFVLSNGTTAKFHGQMSCKSAWICPVCTAKIMAKHAANIAIALDMLKEKGQLACMITFTIPHTSGMSCEETTEILYNTWKDFTVHGNKNQHAKFYLRRTGKMKVSDKKSKDPFASFCEHFNCKHRVRVCEYTYGENGWHPHFHCLFWVDKSKFKDLNEWQYTLNKRWYELAKRKTIQQWNKKLTKLGKAADITEDVRKGVERAKQKNATRAQIMYSKLSDGSLGVYISKDKEGRPIVQKSSMYICGWGADRELTGNYNEKATHDGHLTPKQILERATLEENDEYAKLYLEYITAVRTKNHVRVNFSTRSGLRKMIEEYKQTNAYQIALKKNAMSNPNAGMRVVTWFNMYEWKVICFTEQMKIYDLRAKILEFAVDADIGEIEKLLLEIGVDIRNKKRHPLEAAIEGMYDYRAAVAS